LVDEQRAFCHDTFARGTAIEHGDDTVGAAYRADRPGHGDDRRVRSGEYELSGTATGAEVLAALVSGATTFTVTIPEGLTLEEIAAVYERAGFGDVARFRALARTTISPSPRPAPPAPWRATLPDPRIRERGDAGGDHAHDRRPASSRPSRAGAFEHGLTDQAVILASIVEKEAAVAEERLRSPCSQPPEARQPLQSDPTVLYGARRRRPDPRHGPGARPRANTYDPASAAGLIANPGWPRSSSGVPGGPARSTSSRATTARTSSTTPSRRTRKP
jgi:UPF0755 protein